MKKKVMMLVAMAAMVVVAAVPAMAQTVFLEVDTDDIKSGDVSFQTTLSNSGDNSNQCAPVLNAANSGSVQNIQGIVQFDSEADEIEIEEGGSIVVSPEVAVECTQKVSQSAVASS